MKTNRLLGLLAMAGVLTAPASVFAQKTVVAWTAVLVQELVNEGFFTSLWGKTPS